MHKMGCQGIAMNQYIITEEDLGIIEKDDFFKLPYKCEMWEKRKCFTDAIRSNPYQSERDKLDELENWLDEQVPRMDLEHPFYECKTRTKKKIAELRQAGEP